MHTDHNVASTLANPSLMHDTSKDSKHALCPSDSLINSSSTHTVSMANTAPTRTLSSGDFAFSTFSATIPFSSLKNAVALTTAFTYDSDCLGRWLLSSSRSGETPNIYSLSPTGTNTDPRWTSCQPFNYQSAYSPGMCPEGRTIASVIEAQYTAGNQKNIEWAGLCCERYTIYNVLS